MTSEWAFALIVLNLQVLLPELPSPTNNPKMGYLIFSIANLMSPKQ
jgi:hypothetical protein